MAGANPWPAAIRSFLNFARSMHDNRLEPFDGLRFSIGGFAGSAFQRIMEALSLVVAEDHFVVGDFFNVVRIDWHLAATAGRVDDILRDRVARRVAAERADDLDAF